MNVTGQIASYVAGTSYDDLPQKTVQYAKKLALTNMASMLWGSTLPAGRIVIKFVKDVGGAADAGVIGGGFKTSLPNAALANGTFAHAVEWEGDSRPEMVGAMTLFPVVFPVGEKVSASGADILAAAIIAHEVQSRMGLACLTATKRGFFAVPVFGNFGAAVATAKLLKLDVGQVVHAIGLTASQAAGTIRQHSTMAHFIETGFACRNGVTAALVAREGATSDTNIWEDAKLGIGFGTAAAGDDYHIEKLTEGLGKEYRTEYIDTKRFPCHSLQQRPLEAALHLVNEHNISYKAVESVTVDVNPATAEEIDLANPPDGEHTRVSLQHGIAGILLKRSAGREIFTDERLVDPEFVAARKKVKLVPHPEWPEQWPEGYDIVTIRLVNGKEHSARGEDWRGYHKTPMTVDELIAKYKDASADVLSAGQVDRSIELLLNLEKLKDISELMNIVCFPRR